MIKKLLSGGALAGAAVSVSAVPAFALDATMSNTINDITSGVNTAVGTSQGLLVAGVSLTLGGIVLALIIKYGRGIKRS